MIELTADEERVDYTVERGMAVPGVRKSGTLYRPAPSDVSSILTQLHLAKQLGHVSQTCKTVWIIVACRPRQGGFA